MRWTSTPGMAPRALRPVVLLLFMASMGSGGKHHGADLATPCLASAKSGLSPVSTPHASSYSGWLQLFLSECETIGTNCAFLQLDPSPRRMQSVLSALEWMAPPYCRHWLQGLCLHLQVCQADSIAIDLTDKFAEFQRTCEFASMQLP